MSEVLITLTVIGILATVAMPTYISTRDNVSQNSEYTSLQAMVVKARNVAAEEGNRYQYPTDIGTRLNEIDDRVVAGASTGTNVISLWRQNEDVVVFATRSGTGECYVVRDDIASDTQSFAIDIEGAACDAADLDGVVVSGTLRAPNEVDLP